MSWFEAFGHAVGLLAVSVALTALLTGLGFWVVRHPKVGPLFLLISLLGILTIAAKIHGDAELKQRPNAEAS